MKETKFIKDRWYKCSDKWYVKFNNFPSTHQERLIASEYIRYGKEYKDIQGSFVTNDGWTDDFDINEIQHLVPYPINQRKEVFIEIY